MITRISFCALLVLTLLGAPGRARARYLNTETGRFQTMDSYEGNSEEPVSLHKYLYAANDPVDNVDPSGKSYYFGGSREGSGHFWLAVDIGNGMVMKYDFGRRGFEPNQGSAGSAKDLWYAKWGPGQAVVREFNSIGQAAGPNEYYWFRESAAEDLAMAQRMIDSTNNPPDYNVFIHNCGHQSFEIAQHGWPRLAPMNPLPASFLDVVKRQRILRRTYSAPVARAIGGIEMIIHTFFTP